MSVCLYLQDLTVTFETNSSSKTLKAHNFPALKHWLFIWRNCHHNDFLWLLPVIKAVLARSLAVMTEQKQYERTIGKTLGSISHVLWSAWAMSMYNCGQGKGLNRHIGVFDRLVFGWFMKAWSKTNILSWNRRHVCELKRQSSPPSPHFKAIMYIVYGDYGGLEGGGCVLWKRSICSFASPLFSRLSCNPKCSQLCCKILFCKSIVCGRNTPISNKKFVFGALTFGIK